jgi:hypothetical protein
LDAGRALGCLKSSGRLACDRVDRNENVFAYREYYQPNALIWLRAACFS